jgi:hypothetical protein
MSRADIIVEYFKSHPDQWISAYTLMELGGKMAWRTRVSDARKQLGRIDNEVRRDARGVAESFNRFVPVQRGQAGLFA